MVFRYFDFSSRIVSQLDLQLVKNWKLYLQRKKKDFEVFLFFSHRNILLTGTIFATGFINFI